MDQVALITPRAAPTTPSEYVALLVGGLSSKRCPIAVKDANGIDRQLFSVPQFLTQIVAISNERFRSHHLNSAHQIDLKRNLYLLSYKLKTDEIFKYIDKVEMPSLLDLPCREFACLMGNSFGQSRGLKDFKFLLLIQKIRAMAKRVQDEYEWDSVIVDIFTRIVKAQTKRLDIKGAKATCASVDEKDVKALLYRKVVAGQLARGEIAEIKESFSLIEDNWEESFALCKFAKAKARSGALKKAQEILEMALKRVKSLNEISPEEILVPLELALAKTHLAMKDIESAEKIFEKLKREALSQPYILILMVKIYFSYDLLDVATSCLKFFEDQPDLRVPLRYLDLAKFEFVKFFIRKKELTPAKKWTQTIYDKVLKISCLCKIALTEASKGDLIGSRETIAKGELELNLIESARDRAIAACKLARALAAIGDFSQVDILLQNATSLLSQVNEADDRMYVQYKIAKTKSELSDNAGALELVDQISDPDNLPLETLYKVKALIKIAEN